VCDLAGALRTLRHVGDLQGLAVDVAGCLSCADGPRGQLPGQQERAVELLSQTGLATALASLVEPVTTAGPAATTAARASTTSITISWDCIATRTIRPGSIVAF
jgi:hypothetical protein